ncbi:MAG: phosphate ABC transporter substrate-binding/OmpA family protein [Synechococcales bacterium]|nr:phosphate ABC transporter substrate-binding/OmpA family protein [Synechococcales bacterium]
MKTANPKQGSKKGLKKGLPPIVYIGGALIAGIAGFQGYRQLAPSLPSGLTQVQLYGNYQQPLTVLGDGFSGYSSLRSADFADTLSRADLGIRYQEELDQAQRAADLGKEADLIVTTLDQFLTHHPDGRIVGLIDRTVGADAVVLNTAQFPNLTSLNDLETLRASTPGLKIVYAAGTPSEYLARLLDIKFEQFNLADFEVVEVEDSAQAYEVLQSDARVAIAILWEPDVSKAALAGNTIALSSEDVPNSIIDVMVASNRLIEQRPDELKAFLTAYYQHTDTLIRNASTLNAQIAADGGLTQQDAAKVASGIDFFSSIETEQWFSQGTLEQRIQSAQAVLTLAGTAVAPVPDASALYRATFITEAAANARQIIEAIKVTDPDLAAIISGEQSTATQAVSQQQVQAAAAIGNLQVRGTVSFATGSATLTAEGQQTLDQFAREVSDFSPDTTALNIVGHTSRTGSAAFNQSLSQQRAQVVADYLKSRGVSLQIAVQGMGFSQPLPDIDPTHPQNQRTEVQLKRIGG